MPPRFLTPEHQQSYKRIARMMVAQFGDQVEASMERTEFTITLGSARIDVSIQPWREDAIITAHSVVVSQPRIDFDLMEFLLAENADFDLGAFGISRGGNVIFKHAILGSSCDDNELKSSVWSVMRIADQYDDRIQARWGGQRAIDRPPTVSVGRANSSGSDDFAGETVQFTKDDVDNRG